MVKRQARLNALLIAKSRAEEKLNKIKEKFREEKENEDAWPGHEGTFVQQLDQDYQLILAHLADIEKAIKSLEKSQGGNRSYPAPAPTRR